MNKKVIPLLVLALAQPVATYAEGLLKYKPPFSGAPKTRIGGGTRGLTTMLSQIQVLAPQHTALTEQAQPVLYWYLSQPSQQTIEITLIQEGIEQPLLEKQLPSVATAGLQSIRLADYSVSLQAGEEYRWSVAIINDAEQRSGDVIASATVRYQTPALPLTNVEQQAEAGYWYDALQHLIESGSPQANDLLKQIDLDVPAL